MDEGFHDAVLKVFVDFYNRGLIYRGKRLVNWDPHFETAISDLEVEQVEEKGHLWRLRYPLENGATYRHPIAFDDDGRATDWEDRDYLVVATTRPETMLGDTGVAVHPDDPRYAHLVGKTVRLPLVGRSIPIVADPYADPEKGTGAVKITPAHDFNDWDVGQRHGLPAINVMDTRAHIALSADPAFHDGIDPDEALADLDGLPRYEARDVILTLAEEQGWLDGADPETHTVPHGDRSKVAIEPFLTDQWYVDAATLAKPALAAVRDGPHPHPPRARREDLLPLAGEHRALVHLPPALVGPPDPGLVWRLRRPRRQAPAQRQVADARADEPVVHQEHGRWLRAFCGAATIRCREEAENWYRSRAATASIVRFEGEPAAEAGEFAEDGGRSSSPSAATPTSSTPGSPPASGRSAPSAGPRTPPSSAATTPPPRSSPASTSSSSGSPG